LLLAVGSGCVGHFAWDLRLFAEPSRTWLRGAFAILAVFGCGVVLLGHSSKPYGSHEPSRRLHLSN